MGEGYWARRYGILAGNGLFPHALANCLMEQKLPFVVMGLRGHFQPLPGSIEACEETDLGRLLPIVRYFKKHHAERIFFAGGVRRKHARATLRLDALGACVLPLALLPGDDRLLRGMAFLLGTLGVEVVDPSPAIGSLLADRGLMAGPEPKPAVWNDICIARQGALEIGSRDRGQAAVAFKGNLVGLEGWKGTDALISRAPGPGAVLAKVVKPGQDLRFDRPAIGPSTALLAAARGMRAIAVESGGVLLLDRDRLMEICRQCDISLYGI